MKQEISNSFQIQWQFTTTTTTTTTTATTITLLRLHYTQLIHNLRCSVPVMTRIDFLLMWGRDVCASAFLVKYEIRAGHGQPIGQIWPSQVEKHIALRTPRTTTVISPCLSEKRCSVRRHVDAGYCPTYGLNVGKELTCNFVFTLKLHLPSGVGTERVTATRRDG
jgi:hypothetical protein